ncbi:hypothetical protein [Rhodococcus daqingensis]|uniref:Dehydratase n=1 Tax=Rhodococcus daqingensis TaxID=2479363 RepID=A0ABW2RXZ5_9NOCA
MLTRRNVRASAALLIAGAAASALFAAPVAGAATPFGGQTGPAAACGTVAAGGPGLLTITASSPVDPASLTSPLGPRVDHFFQLPPSAPPAPPATLDGAMKIKVTTATTPPMFGLGRVTGSYTLAGGTVNCVLNVPFFLEP